MPTDVMKKVSNKCDMSMSEVEEKWSAAKSKAADQGHGDDWGYVMNIFKSMVGKECASKMGWTNENVVFREKIESYLD